MAFTNFKSADEVQQVYQIKYDEKDFFELRPMKPSEQFINEFEYSMANFDVFSSEASRCENVIYPILREVSKQFAKNFALWSHKSLAVDDTLSGTPDYIIARRSELGKNVLGRPLVMITEAKQNDFIKGWGQCLAELVAAQRLNEDDQKCVYGIVTDAELWQFGRLKRKEFTKSKTRAKIDDLDDVFGSIYAMLALANKMES